MPPNVETGIRIDGIQLLNCLPFHYYQLDTITLHEL